MNVVAKNSQNTLEALVSPRGRLGIPTDTKRCNRVRRLQQCGRISKTYKHTTRVGKSMDGTQARCNGTKALVEAVSKEELL